MKTKLWTLAIIVLLSNSTFAASAFLQSLGITNSYPSITPSLADHPQPFSTTPWPSDMFVNYCSERAASNGIPQWVTLWFADQSQPIVLDDIANLNFTLGIGRPWGCNFDRRAIDTNGYPVSPLEFAKVNWSGTISGLNPFHIDETLFGWGDWATYSTYDLELIPTSGGLLDICFLSGNQIPGDVVNTMVTKAARPYGGGSVIDLPRGAPQIFHPEDFYNVLMFYPASSRPIYDSILYQLGLIGAGNGGVYIDTTKPNIPQGGGVTFPGENFCPQMGTNGLSMISREVQTDRSGTVNLYLLMSNAPDIMLIRTRLPAEGNVNTNW